MSFQPVVPLSGYSGWRFLERTLDSQREAFGQSSEIQRATDTFRETIGEVTSAQELVDNRQLLEVALGAFGLDDDIGNKFFIKKILEEGVSDDEALANQLADSRYAEFSKAFGFDSGAPNTQMSFAADDIIDRYEARQFERAVGEQDNSLRTALNMSSALQDVIDNNTSNDARWYAMMGNAPLRDLFQTSMGFSSSFAALDLDRQLSDFQSRAEAIFGTSDMDELNTSENREKMIRLYLVRSEMQNTSALSGASVALTLLQQSQ